MVRPEDVSSDEIKAGLEMSDKQEKVARSLVAGFEGVERPRERGRLGEMFSRSSLGRSP